MKKEFGEVLSYISSMTAEWPHARHRPHGPELTRQKKRTGPPLMVTTLSHPREPVRLVEARGRLKKAHAVRICILLFGSIACPAH
jgi:hypothetical protein